MAKVTGIGGIFFKAKDAPALQAWYKRHLGVDVQAWGGTAFDWADSDGKPTGGTTAWLVAPEDSETSLLQAKPRSWSTTALKTFTLWSRRSRRTAATSSTRSMTPSTASLRWVIDPEGNKVELWQPPAGK